MKIPATVPYLKPAVALVGLYAAVWLALEGDVARDALLAVPALALGMAYVVVRRFGGQTIPTGKWLVLATTGGLFYGAGLALLLLFLMAVKTGVHAHGPEYTAAEVAWVWRQLPLWCGAGALAGLGLGLLAAGKK